MNVRTLCLAVLHEGDASGYEIRKLCTEGECAYFVEASFGAIYPALSKLEEDQLVTSRVELQEGRPAKKVYSITPAGKQVFVDALFEDLGEDVFRSEFLLFARFAAHLPASLVEQRLHQRLAELDKKLTGLNQMMAQSSHAADAWVMRYGADCIGVAHKYIQTHMQELIAIARPDADAKAAE